MKIANEVGVSTTRTSTEWQIASDAEGASAGPSLYGTRDVASGLAGSGLGHRIELRMAAGVPAGGPPPRPGRSRRCRPSSPPALGQQVVSTGDGVLRLHP